jgi:hypothetical protein
VSFLMLSRRSCQEKFRAETRVVSVKWWKSVQRVIVRPTDYAARFTASMS